MKMGSEYLHERLDMIFLFLMESAGTVSRVRCVDLAVQEALTLSQPAS